LVAAGGRAGSFVSFLVQKACLSVALFLVISVAWCEEILSLRPKAAPALGVRCGRKFLANCCFFMQHTEVGKRLYIKVRPPAVAAVRDSQEQPMAPSHEDNGNAMSSPQDRFKFEGSSKRGRRPRDCGLKTAGWDDVRAKRTQFRPAARRHRRPSAQNKPNFARPGAHGRRKPCETKPNLRGLGHMGKGSCRVAVARPGSQTCETNPISGPGAQDCGFGIADCGLKEPGCGQVAEVKCAKRTQFGPPGG
jgi:hypothetical protein